MRIVSDTWLLTLRALRESARQPANEIGNAFIPLFFYAVSVGAIGSVAATAFGVEDYKGFQLPVAVLQGAAGIAAGSGLGMTVDIQSGYLDKLMLTSTPRIAVIAGRMIADVIKTVILTVIIIAVAMITGSGFETGPLGMLMLLFAAGVFALVYGGIGMSIALKTGSPQAAQAGFLIFFPLLFLAPTFAPIEVFARWMEITATFNPVTYILEGMRGLVIGGWDAAELARGAAAVAALGVITFSLTALAMRSRQAV
jgi:ABC-2 type transport system permease protein